MTKTIDSKTVREARAEARRTARKGGRTYQQCLDDVARVRGHDHWGAFQSAHPGAPHQAQKTASAAPTPFSLARLLAGGDPVRDERRRAAWVVDEARGGDDADSTSLRRMAARQVAGVGLKMLLLCALMLVTPDARWPTGALCAIAIAAASAGYVALAAVFALIVGDRPGMDRRRAQARSLVTIVQVVGLAAVVHLAVTAPPAYPGVVGMIADGRLALGMALTLLLGGTVVKPALSRAMALMAASAPGEEGTSIMDTHAARDAPLAETEATKLAVPFMDRLMDVVRRRWFGIAARILGIVSAIAVTIIVLSVPTTVYDPSLAAWIALVGLALLAPALVIGICICIVMTAWAAFTVDEIAPPARTDAAGA